MQQIHGSVKKEYFTPKVVVYGDVRELTECLNIGANQDNIVNDALKTDGTIPVMTCALVG
jgi:hypothetical protein